MYAIIKTGGKQVRVTKDQEIYIEKLDANEGDSYEFTEVLMVGGDKNIIGVPLVKGAKVIGEIVKQGRAKKIIVFKYKQKKNYKKKQGHRQSYTKVLIKDIIFK